jgi:hypothetical protein
VDDLKSFQDQILPTRAEQFRLTTDRSSAEIQAFKKIQIIGEKRVLSPRRTISKLLRLILTLDCRLSSVLHSLSLGVLELCALRSAYWLGLPSCKTRFAGYSKLLHFEPSPLDFRSPNSIPHENAEGPSSSATRDSSKPEWVFFP